MRVFTVYALVDPRDNLPRYVGCTLNLRSRINAHHRSARVERLRDPLNSWLRELSDLGLTFLVCELAIETSPAVAATKETRWLRQLRKRGCVLLNRNNFGGYMAKRFDKPKSALADEERADINDVLAAVDALREVA